MGVFAISTFLKNSGGCRTLRECDPSKILDRNY
jgi:hypothetical protein